MLSLFASSELEDHSFARFLGRLGAVVVVYTAFVCFYRVWLHPLRSFGGPLISKITDWSIVRQAASGDRHIETWKEHEKYGNVVRIGPNTLSFNTASALKAIYGGRQANVQKSNWYRTIDAGSKALSVHSEIDRSKHAFRRRVLDHALSEKAQSEAADVITENTMTWIQCLGADTADDGWSPPRNMKDWCNWLSFDLMGNLTFGRDFGCVTKGEHRFVPDVVLNATKFVYVAGFWPFISLVRPLFGTKWASFLSPSGNAEDNVAYAKYAASMMNERLAAEDEKSGGSLRQDWIYHLLRTKDPETGQGLSLAELHADAGLLIHAGSDTTAITLSAALFYLLHHETALTKLTATIRSAFPSVGAVQPGPALNSLTYLRACIDETMRMATPVPSHLPREVLSGGIDIDGHYLAAGTVVGVAPWAIHHNADYYPDPFAFDPDRWITANGNDDGVRLARAAFCPFGIGPRGCAGKRVAYLELTLVLGRLLWTYDISLAPEDGDGPHRGTSKVHGTARHADIRERRDIYQIWDHFVADRRGPVVRFRRRQ